MKIGLVYEERLANAIERMQVVPEDKIKAQSGIACPTDPTNHYNISNAPKEMLLDESCSKCALGWLGSFCLQDAVYEGVPMTRMVNAYNLVREFYGFEDHEVDGIWLANDETASQDRRENVVKVLKEIRSSE